METQDSKEQENSLEIAGFVGKTFEILNNQEFNKIIFWSTNGNEFIIKDINKFQEIVLPKYFRHRNVNSFIRQLNMYGFHKARKENTRSVFSHPYFIRNKEHLLPLVRRKIKNLEDSTILTSLPQPTNQDISAANTQQLIAPAPPAPVIPSKKDISSFREIGTMKNIDLNLPGKCSMPSYSDITYPTPTKTVASTNELIKTNMNITVKRFSFFEIGSQCMIYDDDRDDCVSIEDELEKTKVEFSKKVKGLSLVNTTLYLEEARAAHF